jgi:hypothetical protein
VYSVTLNDRVIIGMVVSREDLQFNMDSKPLWFGTLHIPNLISVSIAPSRSLA